MGKIKSEMATRCELAMMGKVVRVSDDEVQTMLEYMTPAIGGQIPSEDVLNTHIRRYNKKLHVTHMVCNTLMGYMSCVTFIVKGSAPKEEEKLPKKDFYKLCYVLNLTCPDCSELGDCFFSTKSDGFIHRVS